jgi:hypothetical protein
MWSKTPSLNSTNAQNLRYNLVLSEIIFTFGNLKINLKTTHMRKELLLPVALLATWGVAAQAPAKDYAEQKAPKKGVIDVGTVPYSSFGSKVFTGVTIGNSANAYGVAFGPGSYAWSDVTANSILFTHRADPAITPAAVNSGGVVIDFSTDGGTTWSVNQGPVHIPDATTRFNARYPQGVIFNPTGNTVGANAYSATVAPTLSASNGSWGGVALATAKLNSSALGVVSEEIQSFSIDSTFRVFRAGDVTFASGPQKVLAVHEYYDFNATNPYNDTMWLATGTWDATNQKVAYAWSKLHFPVGLDTSDGTSVLAGESIAAFGNTVWIGAVGYNQTTTQCYSPMFVKSTDGGATFGSVINVNLNTLTCPEVGGGTLLSYLQATYADWIFSDLSTAFSQDITVDKNGNPHLLVNICPASLTTTQVAGSPVTGTAFSIYSAINMIVDVTSTDGGVTWKAHLIDSAFTFRGTFGGITEDNRPQIARNLAGDKVFASYFSTDPVLYGGDNLYPDMHLGGVDVDGDSVLMKYNMTVGTTYEATATFGNVGHFAFDNGDGTFTIPTVVQNLAGGDPAADLSPTTFSYWPVVYAPTDTTSSGGFGLEEAANFGVSQSYPNPATTKAYIDINANDAADFSISVVNMLGQVVYAKDLGRLQAGSTRVEIPTAQLGGGMYLYTITDGKGSVTNRMVVR